MSIEKERAEREKLIVGVAKLIRETQEGKVIWERKKPPAFLKPDANTAVDLVYEARYKGGRLRLYEEDYKVEEPTGLEKVFDFQGRFFGAKYPYWTYKVILELVDEEGKTLWTFPRVSGLGDLLKAVQYQDARVKDFLEALTDERSLASLREDILRKIQELNREGLIARYQSFADIADEQTIKRYLSDLNKQGFISGGLGSSIQITPEGQEILEKSHVSSS